MYPITGKEKIKILEEFPEPSLPADYGGPIIFTSEHKAVIGYQIALSDKSSKWKPEKPELDLGGEGERFVILKIKSPTFLINTPYSQEGLSKHPLGALGLEWNSVSIVDNSHFNTNSSYLEKLHYVFQFEDSTLDLVCHSIEKMYLFRGSIESVTDKVSQIYKENA